jgi:GNAT superfamily N-acetyltransferase
MPSDINQLISIADVMHKEGCYKNLNFDVKKLKKHFLGIMSSPYFFGFVDEKKDKLAGAILGIVSSYFFGNDIFVQNCGFFVLPEYRKSKSGSKLLKAFYDAGNKVGVKEIEIIDANSDDPESLVLLYSKCGFKKIGNIYRASFNDSKFNST